MGSVLEFKRINIVGRRLSARGNRRGSQELLRSVVFVRSRLAQGFQSFGVVSIANIWWDHNRADNVL